MTMTGKIDQFGDWIVDGDGMNHPGSGYFIEKSDLPRIRGGGVSDWAIHITEKTWCDPETFVPALKRALERHGVLPGVKWAATVAELQRRAHARACTREAEHRLGPNASFSAIWELSAKLAECGWFPPEARDLKARERHERLRLSHGRRDLMRTRKELGDRCQRYVVDEGAMAQGAASSPSPNRRQSPGAESVSWFVVYTKANSERVAAEALRRKGFGIYLPKKRSELPGGRRLSRGRCFRDTFSYPARQRRQT